MADGILRLRDAELDLMRQHVDSPGIALRPEHRPFFSERSHIVRLGSPLDVRGSWRLALRQAFEDLVEDNGGQAGEQTSSHQFGAPRVECVLQEGPRDAQLLPHGLRQLVGQDVDVGARADQRRHYALRDGHLGLGQLDSCWGR